MDILSNKKAFPHPTAPDFTEAPWKALEEDLSAASKDRAIAKIALKTAAMLSGVRSASAETLALLPRDTELRVGPYVAYLNYAALEVMARSKKGFSKDANPFLEALHGKVERLSKSAEIGADDALASLVDAARFTLYELMHRESHEYGGAGPAPLETIKHHFEAGQHYKMWSDIWQDVVHRNLRLGGDNVLRFSEPELAIEPAIANYRARRRALGASLSAGDFWAQASRRWKMKYAEMDVRQDPRSGSVRFKRSKRLPEEVPFQLMMDAQAHDEMSSAALAVALPRLGGVRVNQLIACWQALAAAVEGFFSSVIEEVEVAFDEAKDLNIPLERFVPVFDRLSLVADIAAAAGVSRAVAVEAIKVMTFDGKSVRTVWGSPLVAVSPEKFAAVAVPFLSGTYLYPLKSWFKDGGADLAEKGFTFEVELLQMFEEAQKEQWPLRFWRFLKSAKISCVARKEEVDLMLLTGERIFVVEAKCFLPGYEPRETSRYFSAVQKASEQAKRKAINIAASRDALKSYLKTRSVKTKLDLDRCPVTPLVVLYHPLGGGTGDAECAVIDRITLSKFLENENPRPMVRATEGWRALGDAEQLYRTDDDADAAFPLYVANPPILRGYKRQVVEVQVELFSYDGEPSGLSARYFDLAPDANEVEVYERAKTAGILPVKE